MKRAIADGPSALAGVERSDQLPTSGLAMLPAQIRNILGISVSKGVEDGVVIALRAFGESSSH